QINVGSKEEPKKKETTPKDAPTKPDQFDVVKNAENLVKNPKTGFTDDMLLGENTPTIDPETGLIPGQPDMDPNQFDQKASKGTASTVKVTSQAKNVDAKDAESYTAKATINDVIKKGTMKA